MRFVTVSVEGRVRPALVRDGRAHALDPSLSDMVAVIERWMDDPASVVARDAALHEECTARLDWEVELAVVIGRAGANIREADAAAHVFGYAVANDVSARDLQRAHGNQWLKGKSLDGSSPMGPWIVTRDEIADPQALALECRVNGVVKQRSNTRHQVFRIPRILAELSQGMTLLPGDVVFTGTPDGVGNARQPPEYLQDGDLLESEIEGIGVLRNRIRRGVVPRHAAA